MYVHTYVCIIIILCTYVHENCGVWYNHVRTYIHMHVVIVLTLIIMLVRVCILCVCGCVCVLYTYIYVRTRMYASLDFLSHLQSPLSQVLAHLHLPKHPVCVAQSGEHDGHRDVVLPVGRPVDGQRPLQETDAPR